MLTTRRALLTGLTSLLAAPVAVACFPAIVRAASLMPGKLWAPVEMYVGRLIGMRFIDDDIEDFIHSKTLPLARGQLLAYQFQIPLRLPKGAGRAYVRRWHPGLSRPELLQTGT